MPKLFAACAVALIAALSVRADTLPRYGLKINWDTAQHKVDLQQTITWTNRATVPTSEIVLNFYPHYRIPEGDYLLLAKTLELLRLDPRDGIDRHGRAGVIHAIKSNGQPLEYHYQNDNPTAFTAKLPKPVGAGESVTIEVNATIHLPNKQGRWGYWQGINYLTNALPVVAFYDDRGWHAMPFVPWHQPFWNEAGHYTATITLPSDEKLACSAQVKSTTQNGDGTSTVVTEPFCGRDFAILCSKLYKETTQTITLKSGKQVTLKCLAYDKHQYYSETLSKFVAEAIPVYSEWFGDYPYSQFTIAESYFGWNGNECAGLILIDERIFGSPQLGRGYAEYLVSHETCHQWWYNLVGSNGYAETFIDEGAATYFTHRMLNLKHGDRKNNFMFWRKNLEWLPNIQRENYRNASLYAAIGKDQMYPAAGELPGYGHLVGLFTGAYDRGSKAIGMIEARLGEDAFMDFIKDLVTKYSFNILQAADYKVELEAYTGQQWDEFFETLIYSKSVADWKILSVEGATRGPLAALDPLNRVPDFNHPERNVTLVIECKGESTEPVILGVGFQDSDEYSLRIRLDPNQPSSAGDVPADVTPLPDSRYRVQFRLPREPKRIALDPDRVMLDRNPGDNVWNNSPRVYFSPLYTMLNETDLTNDFDRWNFGGGPWIGGTLYPDPWYVRSTMIGARAGAYRTQIFNGAVYGAYRTDYRDIVIGADGLLDHQPFAKSQTGFNVERRVAGPYGDVNGSDSATRASAFARYVLQYGSSLYLPPMHYLEAFTTYQDNFLPYARTASPGAVRPDWTYLGGIHHRLNLYTPYWDPECGVWTDVVYGVGVADLGTRDTMHQLRGEVAAVRKFPDWCILGPLSDTRFAIRGVAMGSWPEEGQFYALGGGTLFRGFDLAERQGSFLWVANAELRLPLARRVQWDALDSTVGARNVWLAAFYDVGAIYANGKGVGDIAHALGVGIRVDTAIFSFIERATLRFDMGKTINSNTPFQYWFGVQHAY